MTSDKNTCKPEQTVCPNDKCGKTISNPLEVTDSSQDQTGTYLVCPYCLTRLNTMTAEQKGFAEQSPFKKLASPKKTNSEETKGSGKCNQYLGYLRERPKDAPIPNECLTCPQATKCLLG